MADGKLYFTDPDHYKADRVIYKQAMQHLEKENWGEYEQHRSHLNHYPLASYLDYEYLRRSFRTLPTLQIKNFLDEHKGYVAAKRLHIEWLGYLARDNQWPLYKEFYVAELKSDVLDCYNLQAELVINTDDAPVYEKISAQWTKPYSLNSACDPVFAQWERNGYKTQAIIWKRYQRALLANNVGLTQFLGTQLNPDNLKTVKRLKNIAGNIDYWVNRLSNDHEALELESATVKFILKAISNSDFEKSAYVLEKNKVQMDKADLMEIQRLVAWYYAKTSGEKAVNWIKKHTNYRDESFVDPLLRYSMQDKNWALYKDTFKSLPAVFKNQEEWLYWYVIAQEESGFIDTDPALQPKTLLAKLSQEQSFYGLLAAQKNKSPIFPNTQFTPQKADISESVLKKLGAAIELYHMNELTQSNNDWFFTTSTFTQDEWRQAGIIAYQMGWINRTIQAFGQAKLWTAAEERFPILYTEDFYKNAKIQNIDPGWILAVARQESAFSPVARSPVGALGILQLMPTTASKVAQKMGVVYSEKRLLDPTYNIKLGTKYLREQLDNYNNNYVLATAAYNAGPGRVREWLKMRPLTEDWVHWTATIPYKETRGYVQNITLFSKIYNMKLEFQAKAKKDSPAK
jgi:soluble lytic murein transglycosylase